MSPEQRAVAAMDRMLEEQKAAAFRAHVEVAEAICEAVAAEREAILRTGKVLRDEHSPTHDWAQGVDDLMSSIRARIQADAD